MDAQLQKLMDAVDVFAAEMKGKLTQKYREEWDGWDSKQFVDSGRCAQKLLCHAARFLTGDHQQAVDVANLAMFIAHRHRTAAQSAEATKKGT